MDCGPLAGDNRAPESLDVFCGASVELPADAASGGGHGTTCCTSATRAETFLQRFYIAVVVVAVRCFVCQAISLYPLDSLGSLVLMSVAMLRHLEG